MQNTTEIIASPPTRRPVSATRELTQENAWFWTGSPAMRELQAAIRIAAKRSIPVLIVGETGSGKELVACDLHKARRDHFSCSVVEAPFVPVNVSTIPENLAESILFGHERGAFTSARERQLGKFEIAKRGTLFLDEIQNLDLNVQCKLLRVLQSREVDRLGSKQSVSVDCQVVAATNLPLEMLVAQGRFRKDLYFRLNVFPLYLPPLRHRKTEFAQIVKAFLVEKIPQHGLVPKALSREAFEKLEAHEWPGNYRELEHALVYAHLKSEDEIRVDDLPPSLTGKTEDYLKQGVWH
ncbi:MAG: sigma 54-interacting transcriptional regulator [Bdellovibrionota bacterium]